MPGTDDIVAIQPALAKRSADVVARVRNRAEFPILERNCKLAVPCLMRLSGGPESSSGEPMSTQFSPPAMATPFPIVLIDAQAYHFVEYICVFRLEFLNPPAVARSEIIADLDWA